MNKGIASRRAPGDNLIHLNLGRFSLFRDQLSSTASPDALTCAFQACGAQIRTSAARTFDTIARPAIRWLTIPGRF